MMDITEEPISNVIEPPEENVKRDSLPLIDKCLALFHNASVQFKKDVRREMIVDTEIMVDGKLLDTFTSIDKL